MLKLFFFAGDGDAHGTGHAFHDRFRVNAWLLAQTGEFLEAGAEDLLDARIRVRVAARLAVQLGQVDTRPEALFEALQGTSTGTQQVAALKNHDPRGNRCGYQDQHHQLNHDTGIADQAPHGGMVDDGRFHAKSPALNVYPRRSRRQRPRVEFREWPGVSNYWCEHRPPGTAPHRAALHP